MTEMRLYVDEDAEQRSLVRALRERGIDVTTALEAGMIGHSDEEQLDHAVREERAIYTLNVGDFARLHQEYLAAGRRHCGIIVIPSQRYDVGRKIRRLVDLVETKSAQEIRNCIEFL